MIIIIITIIMIITMILVMIMIIVLRLAASLAGAGDRPTRLGDGPDARRLDEYDIIA